MCVAQRSATSRILMYCGGRVEFDITLAPAFAPQPTRVHHVCPSYVRTTFDDKRVECAHFDEARARALVDAVRCAMTRYVAMATYGVLHGADAPSHAYELVACEHVRLALTSSGFGVVEVLDWPRGRDEDAHRRRAVDGAKGDGEDEVKVEVEVEVEVEVDDAKVESDSAHASSVKAARALSPWLAARLRRAVAHRPADRLHVTDDVARAFVADFAELAHCVVRTGGVV